MPTKDMILLNNGIDPDDDDGDDDEEARKEHGGHGPGYFFHNGAHPNSRVEPPSNEGKTDGDELNTNVAPANPSWWWGKQIPFYELLKSGVLSKQADGTYRQGGGFTMGEFPRFAFVPRLSSGILICTFQLGWDNCSDTPVSEPLFNREICRSQKAAPMK